MERMTVSEADRSPADTRNAAIRSEPPANAPRSPGVTLTRVNAGARAIGKPDPSKHLAHRPLDFALRGAGDA